MIAWVAVATNESQDRVRKILQAAATAASLAVSTKTPIWLPRLGKIDTVITSPRYGRDLKTNTIIAIPSRVRITFKPSRMLRDATL